MSLIVFLYTGNDLHERGFTRAIETDDTYFRTVEERKVDVVENSFLWGEGLAYTHHRKDNFFVVSHILIGFFLSIYWGFTGVLLHVICIITL